MLIPPEQTKAAAARVVPVSAGSPQDLIEAVNALRASYGLAPYGTNSILMAAAQGHADPMAATGRVSHTGAGGSSVTDRLLALGYPLAGDLSLGGFRSENITSGSEGMSALEAVDRWTGDAPHLTTMISPDLTEIGAGVTVHDGRVYYVIDAARPTDSGVPQAVNTAGAGAPAGPTLPPGVSGVIIPVVVVTPNADGDVIHEVKAGQTLWQLAISYDTKIDEIKRLNNLFDNEIYPGTRLLIEKGVFQPTILPTGMAPAAKPAAPAEIPSLTPVIRETAFTSVPNRTQTSGAPANTLAIAIGIIAAALLGGSVGAWWGAKRK
jgi:LysM repeat protein